MNQENTRLSIVEKLNNGVFTLTSEEISFIVSRYVEQHSQKKVFETVLSNDVDMTVYINSNSTLKH